MSDYSTASDTPDAEATPLAHRRDTSYPETSPGPETVVAAGSALAVAALGSQAADEVGDEAGPPSLDHQPVEEFSPAEGEADAHPGALDGAAPGEREAILAQLEAEAAAEFDMNDVLPPETPVFEEILPVEAAPPPELPEIDVLPAGEQPAPEGDSAPIPEFVRLEPEPAPDEAEPAIPAAVATGAVAGIAAAAAAPEAPEPPSVPDAPPAATAAPADEPADAPVGPHFRTDICPRCGQPDFSKGTVLSYGHDFRPTYYKPAGLSWRRLRWLLRPFRRLVEVEAQVCRHCGLVSLQVDTDALRHIEEKYGG